jgi:hypothetical protein
LKKKLFDSVYVTIILFLFQIYFGIIPGWEKITSDFPNYYVSAKLFSEHKDLSVLYDNNLFNEKIKEYGINAAGQFIPYSPPNALVLLPLVSFDPLTAKRIWIVFNVCLIFLCGFLIQRITQWNFVLSLNVLLLSGFSMANDFYLGQIYLFLTALLLCGYLFFLKNRTVIPSVSWGIIMALKYLPVIFFPALLMKKKFRVAAGVFGIVVLVNIFCLLFFGAEVYLEFIEKAFMPHITGNRPDGAMYSLKYQSWDSLLHSLFIYDKQFNPKPVFNFINGYIIIKLLIYSVVICLLTFFHIKSLKTKYFFEITFSMSVISLLILEPSSATYHELFLILPVILLLKLLDDTNQQQHKFYLLILFSAIGFLPTLLNKCSLNGGNLFLSYNRLWLEMIFYFYSARLLYVFSKKKYVQSV